MLQRWEISSLQVGWLVAGAVALTGHALAVSLFLRAGGRDAWMSGLLAFPVGALGVWSIVRLGQVFPGQTVVDYLPRILGYLGYGLAALYPLYFFTVVVFTLRMTTDWMVDTILPETPSWIMAVVYMTAVAYVALGGLDVLARLNQFMLPVLTFLGIFISLGTMPAKDYGLLRPFLEEGLGPVLRSTGLGIGYFGEIGILAMLTAYVRPTDQKRLSRAMLLSLAYVVVTLTGPLVGSIATLGYRVAKNMAYPTFQHWLTLSLARFFERTDLLAVHQWLGGAYVRCAVYLLMAVHGSLRLAGGTGLAKAPGNSGRQSGSTRAAAGPRVLRFARTEGGSFGPGQSGSVQAAPAGDRFRLPQWMLLGGALLVVLVSELAFPTKRFFDAFVLFIYLPAGAFLGMLLPPLYLAIALARGLHRRQGAQSHGA